MQKIDRQVAFTGTKDVAEPLRFDPARLEAYMAREAPGFAGPLKVQQFRGGQSNPTYLLETPSRKYVLRRKPPGKLLPSAHAVDREFRVTQALTAKRFPVAEPVLYCGDESVTGTPFYVMGFVDGRVFWNPEMPGSNPRERGSIYDVMVATLARLHCYDPVGLGLSDFGRGENYVARQIDRWSKQYRASQTQPIDAMERLIEWLPAHIPSSGPVRLVHGDYRLDNMIFANDASRLLAVIDWELSTLGHPFSDLAYQCMQWRLPNRDAMRGLADVDRTALGIPTEAEYIAKYCERMGIAEIPHWKFCLAFSFFRLAAIVQGVKKRGLEGNASNPEKARKSGEMVPVLAKMGAGVI
jgi:aminoglycoside phosphotransferase (APT) family kinase protein